MSHDQYPESSYEDTRPTPPRTVRVSHLVFGLLFLGIAGLWWLAETDNIGSETLSLALPLLLIAAGVLGLCATLVNSRRRHRDAVRNDALLTDAQWDAPQDTSHGVEDTRVDLNQEDR